MSYAPRHQSKHNNAPRPLNKSDNEYKAYSEATLTMIMSNGKGIVEPWKGNLLCGHKGANNASLSSEMPYA